MPKIHCLHGFLGLPEDWAFLREHFSEDVVAWDWSKFFDKPHNLKTLAKELADHYNAVIEHGDVFVGYSLGGRILLHLVPYFQKNVNYVFVACHPGLSSYQEQQARLIVDLEWSQKFLRYPWDHLMKQWNNSDIFNPHFSFVREERKFDRALLSKMLLELSLGNQEVMSFPTNSLYLAGSKDRKFAKIAENLTCSTRIVPDVYHRLPWENEVEFIKILKGFIYE